MKLRIGSSGTSGISGRSSTSKSSLSYNVENFFHYFGRGIIHFIIAVAIIAMFYLMIIPNLIKKSQHEKEIYRNEKCIIAGSNEAAQDFSHDKFHKPMVIKVWLVQRVKDTTQFAELTSTWDVNRFFITKSLWYSKGIGDTLYFKYIRKDRFFRINKENKNDKENNKSNYSKIY